MAKHSDSELIEKLGGPAQVAELLGWEKYGGVQRVQNWTIRGIPAAVKVKYPSIFMPELGVQSTANSAQAATENVAEQGAAHV